MIRPTPSLLRSLGGQIADLYSYGDEMLLRSARATLWTGFVGVNLIATPSIAAEYWAAYVGADRGVYVDTSSIQKSNITGLKSLTQVTFSLSFPVIGRNKIAYVSNEKEVDCQNRRVRDLSMTAFSEGGSVLINAQREGGWQQIGTGASEDLLIAVVCESQPLPRDASRFGEIKAARADYLVKSSIIQIGK